MSGEDYVEIELTLKRRSDAGVLLSDEEGARAWIGRSCLDAASDSLVGQMEDGEVGTFRIRRWVLEKEGFL